MKTRKNIMCTLSMVLVLVSLFIMILPVGAAEPRTSTNGYSWTTIKYNQKEYTISVGIGGITNKYAYSTISCPVADIEIDINGLTVRFDTINHGYVSKTGSSKSVTSTETASESNPFRASSYTCYCPYGTAQVVKILHATAPTVFHAINMGADTPLTANYSYTTS